MSPSPHDTVRIIYLTLVAEILSKDMPCSKSFCSKPKLKNLIKKFIFHVAAKTILKIISQCDFIKTESFQTLGEKVSQVLPELQRKKQVLP